MNRIEIFGPLCPGNYVVKWVKWSKVLTCELYFIQKYEKFSSCNKVMNFSEIHT